MKDDVFPLTRRRFWLPRIVLRDRCNRRNLGFLRGWYNWCFDYWWQLRSIDRYRRRNYGRSITTETTRTPGNHAPNEQHPASSPNRLTTEHCCERVKPECVHAQSVGLSIHPVFACVTRRRKCTCRGKMCQRVVQTTLPKRRFAGVESVNTEKQR